MFFRPNLVPVHELLADDILADAGGGHQVVQLVEKLHAALVVLGRPLSQLVPQDQSHMLVGDTSSSLR